MNVQIPLRGIAISVALHLLLLGGLGWLTIFPASAPREAPIIATLPDPATLAQDDTGIYVDPRAFIDEPTPPAESAAEASFGENHRETAASSSKRGSFFGLQPQGNRIVFIVDVSGSMHLESNGKLRKEIAFAEIEKCVSQLSPRDQFNIILFASRSKAFSPQPVSATMENRRKLHHFLARDWNCGSVTDLEPALALGMSMVPESLFILTDGDAHPSAEVLLSQVRYFRRRFRESAQVHTVGLFLEAESDAEKLLVRLSRENNGSYARWSGEKSP